MNAPQPTVIVINPSSGGCRAHPELVAELRRAAGCRAQIHTTTSLDGLRAVCEEAARRGVERVGVVGGDGSASAVSTALALAYGERPLPELALLRGGTMNTVATCLSVPHASPVKLTKRWLRKPAASKRCATLRVGQDLGFLFGAGLFPNWLREYYAAGRGQPTRRTAVELTLQTAVSAISGGALSRRVVAPVPARVESDGEPWPDEAFISLMVGAVEQVGLGFRIFPQARADEHRVDFIGLRSPGWRLALALPRLYVRRRLPKRMHVERLVGQARLTPLNGTPLTYALDGDLKMSAGPVSIERGPVFPMARF